MLQHPPSNILRIAFLGSQEGNLTDIVGYHGKQSGSNVRLSGQLKCE